MTKHPIINPEIKLFLNPISFSTISHKMTEHQIINPETRFNFKLNPTNHSEIAFYCDKTKDSDEHLLLKSSLLIKVDCSKISKMINFNCISRILFHDADYDIINTTFHLNGSANLVFTFGGSANFGASLILPKVATSISCYAPVRKTADAPHHNGNLPGQMQNGGANANNNNNANANGNADGLLHPNVAQNVVAVNNGNHGPNYAGNGGGGGIETVTIYKYDEQEQLYEILHTDVIANNYDNWSRFGAAIYRIWRFEDGPDPDALLPVDVPPNVCWPGCRPSFGRYANGNFVSLNVSAEWQSVRTRINTLKLYPVLPMLPIFG